MLSLSAMSSTELGRLKETLKTDRSKHDFLHAVELFLRAHPLDGGADTDTVYVVGRLLTSRGIWDEIPARMFSARLASIDVAALNVFLKSAPEYLLDVKKLVSQASDEQQFDERNSLVIRHVGDDAVFQNVKVMVVGPELGGYYGYSPSWNEGLKSVSHAASKVIGVRPGGGVVTAVQVIDRVGNIIVGSEKLKGSLWDLPHSASQAASGKKKQPRAHHVKHK